ncbi:fimbrial protein [Buttiauxella sp. S04-F03]|uniref:fimbrial protein n=1 Tax=Buttiauxella sp. S04-F03 TaxID=2904525 RepID=UPI001E2F5300|nr:fimbrial protein [Buttiauxella sp. S04-F03]MCE0813790.1 hypothetical protein [Buttiauxella sp. S04-F03]
MSFFKLVILIFCFHVFSVFAGSTNCETVSSQPDWTSIHTNMELKPENVNVTIGSNLSDWQVIYEIDNLVIGKFYTTCNGYDNSQYTLLNAGNIAGNSGGMTIYETDVPGIGISVSRYDGNGSPSSLNVYPASTGWGQDSPSQGTPYRISVKYWKIPGKNIPLNNGSISVTGPEVAGLVGVATNYTITSSHSDRILGIDYINNSRILHATLIFQPGTCNIEGDDVRVDMGDFNGTDRTHSEWKDASFKLICPDAYGYHGSADAQNNANYPYQLSPSAKITPNNIKNGRVTIGIVPYTEVIDANEGIIALDGTGAQGYGIQLAWGDYSSQNLVEPASPVVLNSYFDANSLNSGFGAGDTPIGGNAFSGTDNTIKMAARYIRTTGETAPGPANAVVQVIANYQ